MVGDSDFDGLVGEIFFQADVAPFLAHNDKAVSAESLDHLSPGDKGKPGHTASSIILEWECLGSFTSTGSR